METDTQNPTDSKTVTTTPSDNLPEVVHPALSTPDAWFNPVARAQLERIGNIFSKSKMVPELYRGNPYDCAIAAHIAAQLGVDILMFMNKSYQVKGKFAIEAQLVTATVNTRVAYVGGLQWEYSGEGDSRKVVCFGILPDGRRHEAECSVDMAKKAGWWGKADSWWPKMTDQMLAYRSATFLARKYHAHLLLGMQTIDEVREITSATVSDGGKLGGKLRQIRAEVLPAEGK